MLPRQPRPDSGKAKLRQGEEPGAPPSCLQTPPPGTTPHTQAAPGAPPSRLQTPPPETTPHTQAAHPQPEQRGPQTPPAKLCSPACPDGQRVGPDALGELN